MGTTNWWERQGASGVSHDVSHGVSHDDARGAETGDTSDVEDTSGATSGESDIPSPYGTADPVDPVTASAGGVPPSGAGAGAAGAGAGGGGGSGNGGGDDTAYPDDEPDDEPENEPDENWEEEELTLTSHLEELRVRLTRCLIAMAVGFLAVYNWSQELFAILMQPMVEVLQNSTFIFTYPPEAFFTYLKVSIVAGFFIVSPYIFYQIWAFIAPGLYAHERKIVIPVAFFSALFFTAGALFGYFIVFPFGFEFFASFANEQIQFTPKLSEYLGFALKLLFAFGVVFELPIFTLFLARLGMVTAAGMRRVRKYAILVIFVVSAILTPPDPFTQSLMAGPLYLLYEVSIIVAAVVGKKKEPQDDGTSKGATKEAE